MSGEDRAPLAGSPKQAAPQPSRVGRYELLERLGKGGMGVVYRGRDTVLGRQVAVKMLISDLEEMAETRERFFREARSAGQLSHRNIVTIYDFGEENGRAFIVMELLHGESLNSLLARERDLPVEQRLDIMMRVCEGLAFAHSRAIVHRDVKPGNIFITTEGQVKILDFGVARIASSNLTRSGLIVGTPDYMSPEQVQGKTVDQRSDIFSAGVVFYQVVLGRKPFVAKTLPMLLHKVVTEDPPPPTEAEASPELARIIRRALEKDPARRYQRMEELLVDLARCAQKFEQETRALASKTCDRCREVEALLADHRALAEQLGIPVVSEEVAIAPALHELPLFQEVGSEVLRLVPFRRARLLELRAQLDEQYDRLGAVVASWRDALTGLQAAQEQAAAGCVRDALAAPAPEPAAITPAHLQDTSRAVDTVTRARRTWRERIERRVRERCEDAPARAARPLLRLARAALAQGDDERAAWAAENAMAIHPANTEAQELRARVRALSDQQNTDTAETVALPGPPVDDPSEADTVALWADGGRSRLPAVVAKWMSGLRRWVGAVISRNS